MNMTGPTGVNAVRIDSSYITDPRAAAEERADNARGTGAPQAAGDAGAAEVVLSQQRLIAEAAAAEAVDARAVEEARTLLLAGELDTPEAAERAAQAMLAKGL